MKKIKSLALLTIIVLSSMFSYAGQPASTEKPSVRIEKAVFNPTLVSFTMDNSQLNTQGTILTAKYTSAWGNGTYAGDRILLDITFHQLGGRHHDQDNISHYYVALAFAYTDFDGGAVYTGEYYSDNQPNHMLVTSMPIYGISVDNASAYFGPYPYCEVHS
jgi:hypothetical protein